MSKIAIISYFSYGFMQKTIRSIRKYIPNASFLIIDNNPDVNDSPERKASFEDNSRFVNRRLAGRIQSCELKNLEAHEFNQIALKFQYQYSKNLPCWKAQFCEAERDWLKTQPDVQLVKTKYCLKHGEAINLIMQTCTTEHVVLIETDVVINSGEWYFDLNEQIKDLTAVGHTLPSPRLRVPITPSIWNVQKSLCLDFREYNQHLNEMTEFKDTAGLAWFICQQSNHLKQIEIKGFEHLWYGRNRIDRSAISIL